MRPQNKAPRLPQEILDRISDSSHPRKPRGQVSRKESRKEKRRNQKQRKAEYFSLPTSDGPAAGKRKRPAEDEHVRNSPPKRKKWDSAPVPDCIVSASQGQSQDQFNSSKTPPVIPSMAPKRPKEKLKSALQKLAEKSSSGPVSSLSSRPRTQREKEEDAHIAKLEAKLAIGRGDGKQDEDGLDDLLQFVSGIGLHDQLVEHARSEESNSKLDSSVNADNGDDEEEWQGCQIAVLDVVEATEAEPPEAVPESSSTNLHILARPTTTLAQPPSEVQLKISRSVKGLLNRMSEANIGTIVEGVEELYGKFPRHDLTSTISTLLLSTIASTAAHLESYVLLHATFIASLGRINGIGDFVPYFVREAVEMYEQHRNPNSSPVTDADNESSTQEQQDLPTPQAKQAVNLLTLLSSLYNLQIISCVLMFDLIRELLETNVGADEDCPEKGFSEMNVELILVVIRCSGPQMRSDDPSALKDIVQLVQEKIAIISPELLGSRTKFMVETLVNLKNNKLKRSGPGAQSQNAGPDTLDRMKKFLVGFSKKRQIVGPEPLRLTLTDLRSAESKGKWWLIGAAWRGDPLVDRQRAAQDKQNISRDQKSIQNGDDEDDVPALMELARKQGMNTDIRRSVFIVLMQSDDYVDACERLTSLNLTEVRQREIVRVALHCCGNEKQYNPYYALVCQHLCQTSFSHKVTLQFWLWDFLRDVGESKVGGAEVIKNLKQDEGGFELKSVSPTRLRNVAKAYGWWIAKDCVGLSILKPVDFLTLKPHARSFLKELLAQVFLSTQLSTPLTNESVPPTRRNESAVREVFVKATQVEALAMGLAYFIGETFRSQQDAGVAQLIEWAAGIARETLQADFEI